MECVWCISYADGTGRNDTLPFTLVLKPLDEIVAVAEAEAGDFTSMACVGIADGTDRCGSMVSLAQKLEELQPCSLMIELALFKCASIARLRLKSGRRASGGAL